MRHRLAWRRLDQPGAEVCVVRRGTDGGSADGTTVGIQAGQAFSWRWQVEWDEAWRTRSVTVQRVDEPAILRLQTDGAGNWMDETGVRVASLDGCLDVDLAVTPFTNTLAIHRLALAVGAEADVIVAYVGAPDPVPRPVPQRYGRPAHDRWRYDAVFRDFTAEITLDGDGMVARYEHMFARMGQS